MIFYQENSKGVFKNPNKMAGTSDKTNKAFGHNISVSPCRRNLMVVVRVENLYE